MRPFFHVSLHLPIHPIIRRILYFYNICPTRFVSNAWRSLVCTVVLWQAHKFSLSLNEIKSLFTLYKNPKPNSKWLYFKVRSKKTLLRGYPSNVKGWKKKFFFILKDDWEFSPGIFRDAGVLRVPRSWGTTGQSSFVKSFF